jgi:hypothetical protein
MGIARHAVELFVKAALLKRGASSLASHDINKLAAMYAEYYSEPRFSWNVPFRTQVLGVSDDAMREATITQHNKNFPQDQVFRYPMDKQGKAWPGNLAGFKPSAFLELLNLIERDITRLRREIFERAPASGEATS